MTATTHPLITMLRDPAQREQGFSTLLRQHGHALYWHIRRVVVGRRQKVTQRKPKATRRH